MARSLRRRGLHGLPAAVCLRPVAGTALAWVLALTFSAATIAEPSEGEHSGASLQCLLWYGLGCDAIRDRNLCLSSRDGRPWHESAGVPIADQPCAWRHSTNGSGPHCIPYAVAREEILDAAEYDVASCGDNSMLDKLEVELSTPAAIHTVEYKMVHTGGQTDEDGQACRGDTIVDSGKRHFNYYWTYTATSLEQCKAFCSGSPICTGIEYNAKDQHCEVWWKQIQWSKSKPGYQCYAAIETVPEYRSALECLEWPENQGGCPSLMDEQACLHSRDSRAVNTSLGLRIHGEPCVWCGGLPCTSNSPTHKCEAYDWLLRGEKWAAFAALRAYNLSVATCTNSTLVEEKDGAISTPVAPSIVGTSTPEPSASKENVAADDEEEDSGFLYWWYIALGVLLVCGCASTLAYLRMKSNTGSNPARRRRRKERKGTPEETTPMLSRDSNFENEEDNDMNADFATPQDDGLGPPGDYGAQSQVQQRALPEMPSMPLLSSLLPSSLPMQSAPGVVPMHPMGMPMMVDPRQPAFTQLPPMPMAHLQFRPA